MKVIVGIILYLQLVNYLYYVMPGLAIIIVAVGALLAIQDN